MTKLSKLFVVVIAIFTLPASAVSVVVHSSNSESLDKKSVSKIFLGKSKKFPSGDQAVPIDLTSGSVRDEFLSKVLGKSESQLKAYWSKLIFTGKGQAPKALASNEEVLDLISKNPNLIGYIDDSAVNDSVRVVAKF